MVLIRNCPKEYKQKMIPISTHKYKDEGVMDKSVLGITINMRNQKKGITIIEVKNIDGTFL